MATRVIDDGVDYQKCRLCGKPFIRPIERTRAAPVCGRCRAARKIERYRAQGLSRQQIPEVLYGRETAARLKAGVKHRAEEAVLEAIERKKERNAERVRKQAQKRQTEREARAAAATRREAAGPPPANDVLQEAAGA